MHTRGIRCLASLIVMALLLLFASPALAAAPSNYDSSLPASLTEDQLYGSAIVVDADTGECSSAKMRARGCIPQATKIMTLLRAGDWVGIWTRW